MPLVERAGASHRPRPRDATRRDIAEPAAADPVTRCQLRDLGSYLLDDSW